MTVLGDRGIPQAATLEMGIRPVYEAALTRLHIDLCWSEGNSQRSERAEVPVPLGRELGEGWAGWPAYLAAVRLLRTLG